jgi:hypothetical protein
VFPILKFSDEFVEPFFHCYLGSATLAIRICNRTVTAENLNTYLKKALSIPVFEISFALTSEMSFEPHFILSQLSYFEFLSSHIYLPKLVGLEKPFDSLR